MQNRRAMPRHVTDSWRDFLGPGAVTTFLLAVVVAALGLGVPVWVRLRQVIQQASRDERGEADAIVVLGRQLVGDQPSEVFLARLRHGAALWREGLAPVVVVTGGLTGAATRTEAAAGAEVLAALGLPASAILREDLSRHTLENLFNVRRHLGTNQRLLVVSDALHLARAAALARNLGLAVRCSPAPGAIAGWRWGLRAMREAFMVHWYHVGVAWSRAIGSRRLLSRVS